MEYTVSQKGQKVANSRTVLLLLSLTV